MLTTVTAAATSAACTAARWYLDRSSRKEREYVGGHVRMTELRNEGAAFNAPIRREFLPAASAAAMTLLWTKRKEAPVAAGLILGGGMSNLWERLCHGTVYDYLEFPKAPGRARRYVYNLADLAIFAGAAGILLRKLK